MNLKLLPSASAGRPGILLKLCGMFLPALHLPQLKYPTTIEVAAMRAVWWSRNHFVDAVLKARAGGQIGHRLRICCSIVRQQALDVR